MIAENFGYRINPANPVIDHRDLDIMLFKGFLPGILLTGQVLFKMDPCHQHEGNQADLFKSGGPDPGQDILGWLAQAFAS